MQSFRNVDAGWVRSVHVIGVCVGSVSAATTDFSVLANSAFAFEYTSVLEAAVEGGTLDVFPGFVEFFASDVSEALVLGWCEIGVEAGDEVAVFGDAHVAAESEVSAFAVELVLVPFVKVRNVPLFDYSCIVRTVNVNFEFAFILLG